MRQRESWDGPQAPTCSQWVRARCVDPVMRRSPFHDRFSPDLHLPSSRRKAPSLARLTTPQCAPDLTVVPGRQRAKWASSAYGRALGERAKR